MTWLRRSVEAERNSIYRNAFLAAALAHQGAVVEARAAAAASLAADRDFKIRRMIDDVPSKNPKFLAQWEVVLDGMRKAGLPEI